MTLPGVDEMDFWVEMRPCQCEHIAHCQRDRFTPNAKPGHRYQARFMYEKLVAVKTPYGVYRVCKDCEMDCFQNS